MEQARLLARNDLSFARLVLVAAALGLVGCATAAPVVSLTPLAEDVVWNNGQAIVWQEREGLRVGIGFSDQRDGWIRLRVQMENRRAQPVLAEPQSTLYRYCSLSPAAQYRCGHTHPVADPEAQILANEYQANQARASHANRAAWDSTFMLFGAVGGVASIAKNDREGVRSSSDLIHHARGSAIANDLKYDASARAVDDARRHWMVDSLRRTTLEPGQAAVGLISLPADPDAVLLIVAVGFGDQSFKVEFRQQVYGPPRPRPAPRPHWVRR